MSTPEVAKARFAEQSDGEIVPYDYRLYGAKQAGSTDQQTLFVDKKSGTHFSVIYWFNPGLSEFSTLVYPRFCTGGKVTSEVLSLSMDVSIRELERPLQARRPKAGRLAGLHCGKSVDAIEPIVRLNRRLLLY